MKRLATFVLAAALLSGAAAFAQPGGSGGGQPPPQGGPPPHAQPGPPPGAQPPAPPPPPVVRRPSRRKPPVFETRPPAPPSPPPFTQKPGFRGDGERWSRGDRLPPQYRQPQFGVQDWRLHNLPPPPRGYRWYCRSGGHCFLVAIDNGVIRRTYWRDDRDRYWRDRYRYRYTYADDLYYRECRSRPDPAGILIGGLIGGLLGGAGRDSDGGDVVAGIIIGSVIGAALTRDMDCEDRSYAYYAYYHGLNGGRPGIYRWRNPRNRHYGDFHVRGYYYDPDGFHCATFSNTAWLPHRRSASGRACRQPDGAWAFVN